MIFIKLIISTLLFISTAEAAQAFHPQDTSAQKSFAKDLKRGAFKKALKQFNTSFNESYKDSANGYALQSLLMFNSGIELNGLRTLLSLKNPNKINSDLRGLWKKHLKANHPIWKIIDKKASSKWSVVFPYIGNFKGFLFQHYNPKSLRQLKRLENKKIKSMIMKDWNNYQLGLWNGILKRPDRGLKYLNKISNQTKTLDLNQVHLARARLYYQLKQFAPAIRNYQKISKKSDYWTVSLEEQAYTYTVMGEAGLGLAKLKNLFTPVLVPFAGPEPYMLTAFNQEQHCDYISSFKTVTQYKKTFLPRAKSLQEISKSKITPAVKALLNNHESKNLAWSNVNKHITKLPSLTYSDMFLTKYFNSKKALNTEVPLMTKLLVSPRIIDTAIKYAHNRVPALDKKITNRLALLAKKDLKMISNITKKMHLIEAEVIQQLHIKKKIKKAGSFKKSNSREVMVFPDDGEVWLDEIDKYSATIGFCNKKKGNAL